MYANEPIQEQDAEPWPAEEQEWIEEQNREVEGWWKYMDEDKDYIAGLDDGEGFWCEDCKEPCTLVEETFDYAGTHCTHGKSGTHHTGHYVSKCCLAEYTDTNPETEDAS